MDRKWISCPTCGVRHVELEWDGRPYECVPKLYRDYAESVLDGLEPDVPYNALSEARYLQEWCMEHLEDILAEAFKLDYNATHDQVKKSIKLAGENKLGEGLAF